MKVNKLMKVNKCYYLSQEPKIFQKCIILTLFIYFFNCHYKPLAVYYFITFKESQQNLLEITIYKPKAAFLE